MEREQTRFIVLIALIFITLIILNALGVFTPFLDYWAAHPFEILLLFVVLLGIIYYILSQRKPNGKEPYDFRYVFELWRNKTESGKKSEIILDSINWRKINKTLYSDKHILILQGLFPIESCASKVWRELLIVLDPYISAEQIRSEKDTNEVYSGEFQPRKIYEKWKKGDVQLNLYERLAMKEIEKEKIEEGVKETKEEME